jgi:hypothetical protein
LVEHRNDQANQANSHHPGIFFIFHIVISLFKTLYRHSGL